MDPQPSAPPVVAVVVATQQGAWFEEALAALGAQDYPNQSVLVMDPGNGGDCAGRVAAVLPDAYLRRLDGGAGFAAMANDALETVQSSAFLLICHDDVAPEPDAVRALVEEALRSNAGIVAPKLVEWDDPARLLDVGLAVDKTGAADALVERGELDQEQHDGVRDVFAVSSGCVLLRSDLFEALGGFDPAMGDQGAEIDLCWRAQIAGARVMVAPAARVRHLEAGREQPGRDPERSRQESRDRVRTMLKTYSVLHLLRVVPQALVVTSFEGLVAVLTRHWAHARELTGAWWWNLRRLRELRRQRKSVRRARAVPDSEVRRLQVRGSVRLASYLRRRLHAEDRAHALLTAGQQLVGSVGKGPAQVASAVLAVLALALVIGTRGLIARRLPSVGQLVPFPGPSTLFNHFLHGWRTTGMGSESPVPPAFGLLGLGGAVFLGHAAVLQKVLVLGAFPVGAFGAWRLGRPLGSTLGRLVLTVAYLANPLPYNALARGRWDGLLAYAAFPWLIGRLARLCRLAPFDPDPADDAGAGSPAARAGLGPEMGAVGEMDEMGAVGEVGAAGPASEVGGPGPAGIAVDDGAVTRRRRAEAVALGVVMAPLVALAPSVGVALLVAAVGLVLGSALVGEAGTAARAVGATVIALAVAAVLLFPWTIDVLRPGHGWETIVGVARAPARAPGLGALLRFQVGPLGAAPLGWAFLVAAALPLVVGHGWRLAWAVRLWSVALVCIAVAWAGGRGWSPLRLQAPDVLLAPAAIALAAAAALGAVAFELDLRRFRFGWRQAVSVAAGAALALGTLPILGAARDGRWHLPADGVAHSLSWMPPEAANGAFRVLWLGDPEVLPVDGWALGNGLAYATSRNGPPNLTDLLPGPPSSATRQIPAAVADAQRGDTSRLGALLAPMAVRYIVIPAQTAAGSSRGPRIPVPARLSQALQSQIDLRLLPSDPAAVVYENTAWGPGRQLVPSRLAGDALPTTLGRGADLHDALPVLPGGGFRGFEGQLPSPGQVLVSESPSGRWALSMDGQRVPRYPAFGVANAYRPTPAGRAALRFRTSPLRFLTVAVEIGLWALALQAVRRLGRRRKGART